MSSKRNGYESDDDNIRYKLNPNLNADKAQTKSILKPEVKNEDDDIRYMFPTVLSRPNVIDRKPKPKPNKIKVNFWSNKQSSRLNDNAKKDRTNRRHTIATTSKAPSPPKPKNSVVKVRKRVSFLPSPLFSDNHVPMVTVPDDLTIQLNEEEANDLGEDLNEAFVNSDLSDPPKRKARSSMTQTSPRGNKHKRSSEDSAPRNHYSEHELEFFSKYVVQKLRKMETNQRIYSENLINTVLMLGQLGKLNGKSKIGDAH
ncbi:hypothetical protein NE865_15648 [Phthorimaea operculella]|nr:hypothetical protein NE865_15648 [Phthorimaea operculella]